MRAWAVLVVVALATPQVAAAADQFDLMCQGVQQDGWLGKAKSVDIRYRIDLAANRWCEGACETATDIRSVTADQLVLQIAVGDFRGDPTIIRHVISRATGEVLKVEEGGSYHFQFKGSCVRLPFTGLPAPLF